MTINLDGAFFSDWTAAGTRGTFKEFDLESYPLQIQTNSVIGSGDLLYVGFYQVNSIVYEAGLAVWFEKQPKYLITCGSESSFTMPGGDMNRVWTFRKQDGRLQLQCDGAQIFDFNFAESPSEECRKWSLDFARIQFMKTSMYTDTSSDYFRKFAKGTKFVHSHTI